tara:strand:+ start:8151 stop:8762 length:612 start_codon:yes stop_codon:yes gene_type:complete
MKKVNADEGICNCKLAKDKITRFFWVLGRYLCSLGPVSWFMFVVLSSFFLYKKSVLTDQNLLYYIFGCFGFLIALFGFYLNRTKVNLELFEKRYEIYLDCLQALSMVSKNAAIDIGDTIKLLKSKNFHKTKLLFGKEIVGYIDSIYKQCLELYEIQGILEGDLDQDERKKLVYKKMKIIDYLMKQTPLLPEKFEKYLSFKHIY